MGITIQKYVLQCKRVLRHISQKEDLFIIAIILLTAFSSFGMGRLSIVSGRATEPRIEMSASAASAVSAFPAKKEVDSSDSALNPGGYYVASAKGTKYHLPWCAGASQISDTNKIIFQTKEEAEKAGYGPAGNCKGI